MCYDPVNLTVVEKDKDIFVRKIPFLQIWEKLLRQHEELELLWMIIALVLDTRLQTCQVTLISRVRPAFWPVNQHSLAENLNYH